MSDLDELDEQPDVADLRAEGVAASRSPRTLLSGIALFAPTAYAAAIVLRDAPHAMATRVAIGALAIGLVSRGSTALDEVAPEARRPGRIALASGVVGATIAAGLPLHRLETPMLARMTVVAASTLAAASALLSASALPGLGGIGAPATDALARNARRIALGWLVAGAAMIVSLVPLVNGIVSFAIAIRIPLAATIVAGTVIHLLAAARARQHELGARERHELLLGAATLALPGAIAIATGLEPLAARPRIETLTAVPALAFAAAALVAHVVADPVRAAIRVGRAWVVVTATGVAGFAVLLATPAPSVALVVGTVIGLCADYLSRVLGVEGARVMAVRDAIGRGREAATTNDPNEVARGVLAALRILAGDNSSAPRMILFSPLREVYLDAAGEPRTRDPVAHAEPIPDPDAPSAVSRVIPAEVLALAASEPLGIVRTTVLRALEVRRPDLRPALRFCEQREIAAVASIIVDGELDGVLMLPHAAVPRPLGLSEVRALRAIARLSSTRLSLEAALARASARAQRAELRAREIEHVVERAHHREERLASAVAAASRPLERGVAVVGYAPASRALIAELDALARARVHLIFLHRPGTDPVPWVARLHRESGRAGALHVVDAGRREGSDARAWDDPVTSPIELARDGTLCVLSAHALPRDAQRRILAALSFREGPGADPSPVDLRVVLASASVEPDDGASLERLQAALDPALYAHLREAPLRIVPLARRTEDLHAIALDRLATLGVALGGEPFGVAPDALAMLVEHEWTGDDLELEDVLVRAVLRASAEQRRRVEAPDLRVVLSSANPARDPDGSARRA